MKSGTNKMSEHLVGVYQSRLNTPQKRLLDPFYARPGRIKSLLVINKPGIL